MVLVILLLLRAETFTVKSHKAYVEGEYMYSVRIPDNKGKIINDVLFKIKCLVKLSQYFGNLAKVVMRSHNEKILELSFQNIG